MDFKQVIALLLLLSQLYLSVRCNQSKQDNTTPQTTTSPTNPLPPPTTDPSNQTPIINRKVTVGFYNCENLFDIKDNPNKDDDEFLPSSPKQYNATKYNIKISHIAEALKGLEDIVNDDTVALIGLAEVENIAVLQDVINHNILLKWDWKIIHRESSDPRGIDVAILYNSKLFNPKETSLLIGLKNGREILSTKGLLLGKPTYIFVNHWTSRIRGGEGKRITYANNLRTRVDEILTQEPNTNIIIMGDFNDNPSNQSIRVNLATTSKPSNTKSTVLYNPFYNIHGQGLGTSLYDSQWDLFDQIIISSNADSTLNLFRVLDANIFNAVFLRNGTGTQRKAPKRFYSGNTFVGGYSDHFPVYLQIGAK